MKSVLSLVIPPMLLVVAATASPSPSMFQAPPVTPQEPTVFGQLFRVDPVSGAPIALEAIFPKQKRVGPVRTRAFRPDEQTVEYYFKGAQSSVRFTSGEPHVFVLRIKPLATFQEELLQELQQALSPLVINDGKRFFTNTTLPLDVRTLRQARPFVDNKKANRVDVMYQLTPRGTLPPGGYVLSICSRPCDFTYSFTGGSFDIAEPGGTPSPRGR
jgi:hypothetical protein